MMVQRLITAGVVLAVVSITAPGSEGNAQVPSWICDSHKTDAEKDRREYLRTTFAQRLQDYATRTGAIARLRYNKAIIIYSGGRPPEMTNSSICRKYPQFCENRDKPGSLRPPRDRRVTNLECRLNPNPLECKSGGPTRWVLSLSFDDAVQFARTAARSAIDGVAPLPTRSALIAQIASAPSLAQLPPVVRNPIAEYALALELQQEGRELTNLYVKNLVNRECAFRLHEHYDPMVFGMPPFNQMNLQLNDAINTLSPFGLPGQTVPNVTVSVSWLAGFKSSMESVLNIANSIVDNTTDLADNMLLTDQQITDRDLELPPFGGDHYLLLWLTHPLAGHRVSASQVADNVRFNLAVFDDAIALLRSGLTSFPEGGGTSMNWLGPDNQIHTYCEGIGGAEPALLGILDADGHLGPWLNAQPGMIRGDAELIVQSAALCSIRWTLKQAWDLKFASFFYDRSLEVESSQHPSMAATLKQSTKRKELQHNQNVTDISARAHEIDQIIP